MIHIAHFNVGKEQTQRDRVSCFHFYDVFLAYKGYNFFRTYKTSLQLVLNAVCETSLRIPSWYRSYHFWFFGNSEFI